jgi:hypothetical protein
VHRERVEKEDGHNSFRGHHDVGREDLVDPLENCRLVKPCLILAGVDKIVWQG